jgi:hypothetical protein
MVFICDLFNLKLIKYVLGGKFNKLVGNPKNTCFE